MAHGDAAAVARKVGAYLEAGADHVILLPLTGDYQAGIAQLLAVAPALPAAHR